MTTTAQEHTTEAEATGEPYLINIDPRDLLTHPGNLRADLGDYTALQATIAADGLLQAVTAVEDAEGGYRLVAGHRRTAAAAAGLDAGMWPEDRPATIPVLVRPDLEGRRIQQVLAMLNENDADQRVSLTATERASGYAQLAAFDLTAEEMARRTGKKAVQVRAALKLAGMSETVRAYADADKLTFDDIGALEEFEDDPKAVDRIMKDAGTAWGIRHRLADERRKRSAKARREELTAELTAAGVKVIKEPKRWPYDCQAVALSALRDADGNTPDPEHVKTTEGYAAIIYPDREDEVVYVCLAPELLGYGRPSGNWYKTEAKRAEEAAERTAREARRAAMNDARELRERFIIETYGNAKAAKAMLVDALQVAASDHGRSLLYRGDRELITALAGGDIHDLTQARTDRLNRVMVARYVAGEESHLSECAGVPDRYGLDLSRAVAWLDRLTAAGYTLSDMEAQVRAELAERIADQAAAETDQDDEDQDDEGQEEEGADDEDDTPQE